MPQSLNKKLITRLFLITAFVSTVLSMVFYNYVVRKAEVEFQSRIQTEADQLASIFTEQLWLFDLNTTEKLAENALRNPDVRWICLRDQRNNIVAEAGHSGADKASIIQKSLVHKSGVKVGEMDISFSDLSKDKEEQLILEISILSALATLLFTITLIIYTLNKHLVLPLKELQKDMTQVASGKYKQSQLIGQTEEIQSIIEVYNQMANFLAERESERETLIADLQNKNAEQERFVYTMSHDLKTPLVTISGFSGVAKEEIDSGNPERSKIAFDYITQATNHMRQLINDILEVTRVGFKVNVNGTFNFGDLANQAIENCRGLIKANQSKIEVEQDLPDIVVDKKYFLQAMENLLANASKYSRTAKEGSHVKVGVSRDTEKLTCYVKDNGIGLEPQHLEKIFGLFDKLDTDSQSSGVGLAIVKRIIETHGGRIWAESQGLGHGTTFFFTLPDVKS